MQIGATLLTESVEEKLLGVTLDKYLDFKSHVNSLCKNVQQKLHEHLRVSNYVDVEKLRIMVNAFVSKFKRELQESHTKIVVPILKNY